jgi:hypothetical protein
MGLRQRVAAATQNIPHDRNAERLLDARRQQLCLIVATLS